MLHVTRYINITEENNGDCNNMFTVLINMLRLLGTHITSFQRRSNMIQYKLFQKV